VLYRTVRYGTAFQGKAVDTCTVSSSVPPPAAARPPRTRSWRRSRISTPETGIGIAVGSDEAQRAWGVVRASAKISTDYGVEWPDRCAYRA